MATLTDNKNYLASDSFKVVISRKDYPNLEYFCTSVMHADVNVGEAPSPVPRLEHYVPGDRMALGTITCSVILDENMNSYKEIYGWCESLINGGAEDTADITLQILSSKNNITTSIHYRDAFPTSVSNLQFTTSTNEYITFDVTFRMSYFDIE
jgi:hypothetical protein